MPYPTIWIVHLMMQISHWCIFQMQIPRIGQHFSKFPLSYWLHSTFVKHFADIIFKCIFALKRIFVQTLSGPDWDGFRLFWCCQTWSYKRVSPMLLIKSPRYTGSDFMFLFRFVRRRRRRPQILVHAITFEQLFGFLSFLARLLALTCTLPD